MTEHNNWHKIEYACPICGHEWVEYWDCACDSQCPMCETKNVTALKWTDTGESPPY